MFDLPRGASLFLIGIGGVGMTPLALFLHQMGYTVAGSDKQPFRMAETLRQAGIQVYSSHHASQVAASQLVIYSTAIPTDNPEYREASRLGIPSIDRLKAVSELVAGKRLLSITGSYGKSTTTSFSAFFANTAGLNPSYLIGADLLSFLPAQWNQDRSNWFVFETDESRPEFLRYSPFGCVVTNIGTDHLVHYQNDIHHLQDHLLQYLQKTDQDGCIILSEESVQSFSTFPVSFKSRVFTCGTDSSCEYRYAIQDIRFQQDHFETEFTLQCHGMTYPHLILRMPGEKYVLDAVLAYALVTESSGNRIDPVCFQSLPILDRRSQLKKIWGNCILLDDEGDSPDVIQEVLINARNLFPNHTIIPIVQPHRYSRLNNLLNEYARVLSNHADEILLLPVYTAGEEPIQGVDSAALANRIRETGFSGALTLLHSHEEAAERIRTRSHEKNIFILLGPGDVWQVENVL